MKKIIIRPANIMDAPAISAVHCSNIARWQVDGEPGRRPARYADLTPYQRWLHGGPWLDPGSCAFHLRRLLAGGGIALAAELGGRVVAEAELHPAQEPPPFRRTINLSVLYVHRNHQRQGIGSALMARALELAEGFDTFTVANAEAPGFYQKHGLRLIARYRRFQLPVRPTKVRYTTEPLQDGLYELVRGWGLLIGRYQNAHHDWERTRPGAVPDFVEWRHLRLERHWLTVGDRRSAVIFEESPGHVGTANTFLFTPSPVSEATPSLLSAARDLAAGLGFTHLHCFAPANSKLPGATPTDYEQQLFWKQL